MDIGAEIITLHVPIYFQASAYGNRNVPPFPTKRLSDVYPVCPAFLKFLKASSTSYGFRMISTALPSWRATMWLRKLHSGVVWNPPTV